MAPSEGSPDIPPTRAVAVDLAKQGSGSFDFPDLDLEIPPPDFVQPDVAPAPKVGGSQVGGAPDFAQLAGSLSAVGIKVTLVDLSAWSADQRAGAWSWVHEDEGAPDAIPEWLALFVGRQMRAPTSVDAPTENKIGLFIDRQIRAQASVGAPAPTIPIAIPPKPQDTDLHPPPMHIDEPRQPLFATAHRGAGITPDFQRIVETVFAADSLRDYTDLEQNLQVGEERGDYRTLMTHLDKAEDRARRAHRLYLGAKIELESWEQDANKVTAVMRGEASATLEAEKAAGERKKAITNPDVEAKMSEMFADEYAGQALTRARLKGTVEHLEWLAGLWKGRCHSLGTMLANLRK